MLLTPKRRIAFDNYTKKSEAGCWLWVGPKFTSGYGSFWDGVRYLRAHRVAYELYIGPIQGNLEVMHTCDRPECVNPNHLILGTHLHNMQQMSEKGRAPRGSRSGSAKLTVAEIWQIRELYTTGHWTTRELSSVYGIGAQAVSRYVNFQRFADEPNPYERKKDV